ARAPRPRRDVVSARAAWPIGRAGPGVDRVSGAPAGPISDPGERLRQPHRMSLRRLGKPESATVSVAFGGFVPIAAGPAHVPHTLTTCGRSCRSDRDIEDRN